MITLSLTYDPSSASKTVDKEYVYRCTCVKYDLENSTNNIIGQCMESLNVNCKFVDDIEGLLSVANDHNDITDIFVIDVNHLISSTDISASEILRTIQSLLQFSKKTFRFSGQSVLPHIVVAIDDRTSAETINELVNIPRLYLACLPIGSFTVKDFQESIDGILHNNYFLHSKIKNILRPKKHRTQVSVSLINLTPRETQIYNLIKERGASNKVIAKTLNISESTVKLHVGNLLKKYKVKNRTQLVLFSK